MNSHNIFDGLVNNEVRFTELFRNMCSYRVFRRVVGDWLHEAISAQDSKQRSIARDLLNFTFEDVRTQVVDSDHGRPDVWIQNDRISIILEIKVLQHTGTTEKQRNTYVELLNGDDGNELRALFFAVPDTYAHMGKLNELVGFARQGQGEAVPVVLAKWSDLVRIVRAYGLDETDGGLAHCIGALESWFEPDETALTEDEVRLLASGSTGGSIGKLLWLTDTAKHLSMNGIKRSHSRFSVHDYSYYFSSRQDGTLKAYLGFSYGDWIEHATPIIVGVPLERRGTANFNHLKPLYEEDDLYFFGVKSEAVQGSQSAEKLVKLLGDITGLRFQWGKEQIAEISSDIGDPTDVFKNTALAEAYTKVISSLDRARALINGWEGVTARMHHDPYHVSLEATLSTPRLGIESGSTYYIGYWYWQDENSSEGGLWVGGNTPGVHKRLEASDRLSGSLEDPDENKWRYRALRLEGLWESETLLTLIVSAANDIIGGDEH